MNDPGTPVRALARRYRLFAALPDDAFDELAAGDACFLTLLPGETTRCRPEQVLVVLDGRWCLEENGAHKRVWSGPDVLNLGRPDPHGPPDQLEVHALSEVHLVALLRDRLFSVCSRHPASAEVLLDALSAELDRCERRVSRFESYLRDHFLPGNALIVPGPYETPRVDMYLFVMEGGFHQESGFPPGVFGFPRKTPTGSQLGRRYILAMARFSHLASSHARGALVSFSYEESAVFVPCWSPTFGAAYFCPEIYPESYLAIAIGREVYGLPKRFAYTTIPDISAEPDPGDPLRRWATLILDGHLAVDARWQEEHPYDDVGPFMSDFLGSLFGQRPTRPMAPLLARVGQWWFPGEDGQCAHRPSPVVPVVVRHRVPRIGPRRYVSCAYDRLRLTCFHVTRLARCVRLARPEVSLPPSTLPVSGTCLAAYQVQIALRMGRARSVLRYDRAANLRASVLSGLEWWEDRQERKA